MEPIELQAGESHQCLARSLPWYCPSGTRVEEGGRYLCKVPDGDRWKDWHILCGPKGWLADEKIPSHRRGCILRSEKKRRVPDARWFELIGTIGKNRRNPIRFGEAAQPDGVEFTALETGPLYFFANDLWFMHWNNRGALTVTITRLS